MVSVALVVDVSGAVLSVIVDVSVVVDGSVALVVDVSGAVVVIMNVYVVCRCFCCNSGGCFRSSGLLLWMFLLL